MLVKSFPKKKKGEKMVKDTLMRPFHEEHDITPLEDVENILSKAKKPMSTTEVLEKSEYKHDAVLRALKKSKKIKRDKERNSYFWFMKDKEEQHNDIDKKAVKIGLKRSSSGSPKLVLFFNGQNVTIPIRQKDYYDIEHLLEK